MVEFIERAIMHSKNGKFLYFLRSRVPGNQSAARRPPDLTSLSCLSSLSLMYQLPITVGALASSSGLPPTPVQLLYPVSRFSSVKSLQHLCRFCIRQLVRIDHIQELPLPT